MATPIMTSEQIIAYSETRLFGTNVGPDDVSAINLHNGILPSRLEHMLSSVGSEFERVEQKNGREPVFFQNGVLHIPQFSGFGRRMRYEELIEAYITASDREINFRSLEVEGRARKTNHAFDN